MERTSDDVTWMGHKIIWDDPDEEAWFVMPRGFVPPDGCKCRYATADEMESLVYREADDG